VGDEMLTNPGAENGSLGWDNNWWGNDSRTTAPTFTVSSDAHSGAHSLRVDWSGRIGGQYDGDAKWTQGPFNVVGGHYYSFSDWYKSSGNTELAVWTLTSGGVEKWYNLDIGIAASSTWAQYRSGFHMPANVVQAQFVHVLDDNGFLQTDDASMVDRGDDGFNRGLVSLTFDDGSPSARTTSIPKMNTYGFKSTQYLVTGVLNQSGEWSSQNVRDVDAMGHEIGSHTITHPFLTTLSLSAMTNELTSSQNTLQSILGKPVPNFATPYGDTNGKLVTEERNYYRSTRGVETGYESKYDLADSIQGIRVQNMLKTTTMAEYRGWVDFAAAHKLWLVIVYHGVLSSPGDFDTTPTLFDQQLAYLNTKGIAVRTMQDALDETLPQAGIPVTPPIDNPPETTITSQPPSSTTSTGATFQFTANESGSTFECNLDNAGFTPCVSAVTYSGLALGQHTFSVRATDTSNQTDATPATASWTINTPVDTTPPNTTISSGPSNPTTSTSASFAFSSSESGSTFECKLDSGTYAGCTSPKSYSGLSIGQHTFSVRATDAAGNTDATPATRTWTINTPAVDTTPPGITITRPVNGQTYLIGNAVRASYSCSDASGISSCIGTVPSGELIDTSVQNTNAPFTVNAVDNAGNTASRTVTYRVCKRKNCR
jgi:peptidoglycan/xylan/chitin deacetylase (PgdA/CDA1 family)